MSNLQLGTDTDALAGNRTDVAVSPAQVKRMIKLFLHSLDSRIDFQNKKIKEIEQKLRGK